MYFSFLPLTTYELSGSTNVVRDILRRSAVVVGSKQYSDIYTPYTIKDGDIPESVAFDVYGSASYHWVILQFNEIHDYYFDWPMTDSELLEFCNTKYPGTFGDSATPNMYKIYYFEKNGIITGGITEFIDIASWVSPTTSDETAVPVTFYDYESSLNEKKRVIKLLRPELLADYVRMYKTTLGS